MPPSLLSYEMNSSTKTNRTTHWLFSFVLLPLTQLVNTPYAGYNQICHNICLLVLDLSRSKVYLPQVLYRHIRKNELKVNTLAKRERAQKLPFHLSRVRCIPADMHLFFLNHVSN